MIIIDKRTRLDDTLVMLLCREPYFGALDLTVTDAQAGNYDTEFHTNGYYTVACTATYADNLTATADTSIEVFYRKH